MMREIKGFQPQPEFVVGDTENLRAVEEKINQDAILLSQIEADYKKAPEQHKPEFVSAKINHLKNQYLYNWLILKWHFDQALGTMMTSFPDYQKEEMKKHGWMFPQAFINTKITTSGEVKETTEDLYIKYFDKWFDKLFQFNIGEKNSRIDRYYQQAIFNYKSNCYYSCAVSLFPIIESYHQFTTNFNANEFYRIKDHLNSVGEKMENLQQIYSVKIDYYVDLVNQFNDLVANHYFSTSLDRTNEPEIINRNRIMHGVFSREISQKDCLQLFCVISNMITIKTIINANDNMNQLAEEIKQLEQAGA